MADETTPPDDTTPPDEQDLANAQAEAAADDTVADQVVTGGPSTDIDPESTVPAEVQAVDPASAESVAAPATEATTEGAADASGGTGDAEDTDAPDEDSPTPSRERPAIPGADLEVDIIIDGEDRTRRPQYGDEEDLESAADEQLAATDEETVEEPITQVAIDLRADARYTATGKRKSAIARVILKPGTGAYIINGKTMDAYFPRPTLQRTIRQPLETVGFEDRMDVVARMTGGGVSAQAGALRHGISRALLEADPNLRGELKRRGFLTRDARAKERKKAGLKKARKKPQFSKR